MDGAVSLTWHQDDIGNPGRQEPGVEGSMRCQDPADGAIHAGDELSSGMGRQLPAAIVPEPESSASEKDSAHKKSAP
jgi:hypothetical protein